MVFEITEGMATRDSHGVIRKLNHPMKPYRPAGVTQNLGIGVAGGQGPSARAIADAYLREVLPEFGIRDSLTSPSGRAMAMDAVAPTGSDQELNLMEEKTGRNQATVSYAQSALGLQVWRSGVSVRLRGTPLGVVGADNNVAVDLEGLSPPPLDAPFLPERITADMLPDLLGLDGPAELGPVRMIVFRFEPGHRGNAVGPRSPNGEAEACPQLNIPDVDPTIEEGSYYVVSDVAFSYSHPGFGPLNWQAFIEPATGSVLRIEALVSCVAGMVLDRDPITASGVDTPPTASTATLDALRVSVDLPDVATEGGQHHLRGPFVTIENVSAPVLAAPTIEEGAVFDFSVPTDDFAAVNAYFHCDRCFRLVDELGFDVSTYFDGTSFPVRVDHRATINGQTNNVNAQAPGALGGTGSDGFRFALLAPGSTVGMAVEQRVTWHEFGHAILWDHLHSPNFPFAHSPGDTIAAILQDPDSNAPDRGRTFPWTIIRRRHDHEPSSGFAWGGDEDDPFPVGHIFSGDRAGYQREQILSSSLFRFYRSIGGGHQDIEVRRAAARRAVWLLLETIAGSSPVAPPQKAEDFVSDMIEAELFAQPPTAPLASGIMHKVLRWAFERQGLFQPPGAPTPVVQPGAPPSVDVFIDDSRAGGYEEWPTDLVEPPGLRFRYADDAGADHQEPVKGAQAFAFVTVGNRGSDIARGVRVGVSVRVEADGTELPDGWQLLTGDGINQNKDIAPGVEETFGPFVWTPDADGVWQALANADCDDDRSNLQATMNGEAPALMVAHLDNNTALRRMTVETVTG